MESNQTNSGTHKRLSWYENWHKNPMHPTIHWFLFLLIAINSTSLIISNVAIHTAFAGGEKILSEKKSNDYKSLSKLTDDVLRLSHEY